MSLKRSIGASGEAGMNWPSLLIRLIPDDVNEAVVKSKDQDTARETRSKGPWRAHPIKSTGLKERRR